MTDPDHATAIQTKKGDDGATNDVVDIDGTRIGVSTAHGLAYLVPPEEGAGAKVEQRAEQMKFQVGWLVLPRAHAARCQNKTGKKPKKPPKKPQYRC